MSDNAVPAPGAVTAPPRRRIMQAALDLIAERGLGGVTMSGIAEAAAVSRQTLYNHYRDIDTIVADAISEHEQASMAMLESALQVVETPHEQLEQLVRHMVAMGAHAQHASAVRHGLSTGVRTALGGYERALDDQIRSILEEGQRTGVFRADLTPDIDVALLRHMLYGLMEQASKRPDTSASVAVAGSRMVAAAVAVAAEENG